MSHTAKGVMARSAILCLVAGWAAQALAAAPNAPKQAPTTAPQSQPANTPSHRVREDASGPPYVITKGSYTREELEAKFGQGCIEWLIQAERGGLTRKEQLAQAGRERLSCKEQLAQTEEKFSKAMEAAPNAGSRIVLRLWMDQEKCAIVCGSCYEELPDLIVADQGMLALFQNNFRSAMVPRDFAGAVAETAAALVKRDQVAVTNRLRAVVLRNRQYAEGAALAMAVADGNPENTETENAEAELGRIENLCGLRECVRKKISAAREAAGLPPLSPRPPAGMFRKPALHPELTAFAMKAIDRMVGNIDPDEITYWYCPPDTKGYPVLLVKAPKLSAKWIEFWDPSRTDRFMVVGSKTEQKDWAPKDQQDGHSRMNCGWDKKSWRRVSKERYERMEKQQQKILENHPHREEIEFIQAQWSMFADPDCLLHTEEEVKAIIEQLRQPGDAVGWGKKSGP